MAGNIKLDLVLEKLSKVVGLLHDFHYRTYEVKDIEDLLYEAYEDCYDYASKRDLQHNQEIDDLRDFYENIKSYLNYYEEGEPTDSLRFLIEGIERVADIIEKWLEYSDDETSDFSESSSESEIESDFYHKLNMDEVPPQKKLNTKHKLSDGLTGYESDIDAKQAEWMSAKKSEQRFFAVARNKKESTGHLTDSYFFNRTTTGNRSQIIDSTAKSARALISADVAAVQRSLPTDPTIEIKSADDIQKYLKWNKTKQNNWNREKVKRNKCMINYQFHPSPRNLGNYFMNGLGDYGLGGSEKTPNILEVINDLTDIKPEFEKKLAKLLLKYSHDGIAITEDHLYDEGFSLYVDKKERDKLIKYLNRFAHNICVKEISRRKHQSHLPADRIAEEVPEYPFGVAIAKTLCLLADGHLRMEDVFDADAPYGVFSGKKIMLPQNLDKTKEKLNSVLFLYNRVYAETIQISANGVYFIEDVGKSFLEKFPDGKIVASSENHHQALLQVYGGESESSGDEYNSLDREDENNNQDKQGYNKISYKF